MDGRVLFFAMREGAEQKPEYQVKIWDPLQNKVDIIAHNLKPRRDTDIAVLRDGRVLLVNGYDASADMWDSRNNTLLHHEVTELENQRWRLLQLRNGQIMAIAEYPDTPSVSKKGGVDSVALLWDTQSEDWRELHSLPVPFRTNAALVEMDDASVQAKVAGRQFKLVEMDKDWDPTFEEMFAAQCKDPEVPKVTQQVAASSVAASQNVISGKPREVGISWFDNFHEILISSKWLLLAIITPLLLFMNIRKLKEGQQQIFLTYAGKIFKLLGFLLFIYIILVALWALGNSMLKANMLDCGSYQHNSMSAKEPYTELKKFAACVEDKNGVLESLLFYKTKKRIESIPSVPCRYVGEWMSTRSNGKFRINLSDNSRFVARKAEGSQDAVSTGSWAVANNEILWFYDGRFDHYLTYEANPILTESMREFALAEENGEHTVFELLEPIKSANCKQ
jgi:hypothetical protein